jgi:hypothetical protein
MANELTTLIMNNIVQKCSGYKSNNSGRSAGNANPIGGKQVSLPSGDVKNLTDLIHKTGKTTSSSKPSVTTAPTKSVVNNNSRSGVKHLDDLIGKKVSKSLSGSTAKTVEKTPVRSTSNNNMSLDSYLKGLKK